MANQEIPLYIALTSTTLAVLGTLLGVHFTNKASLARSKFQLEQASSQRKELLLRERGEELYELADKWLLRMSCYYLELHSVMQGKITYNEALDMQIEAGKIKVFNFGRIEMLIDVYFPETRNDYDKLIKMREDLNDIVAIHKQAYKRGDTDGTRFIDSFVKGQLDFVTMGEKFKTQVIKGVQAL